MLQEIDTRMYLFNIYSIRKQGFDFLKLFKVHRNKYDVI